jgi:hypothetical protein
VEQGSEVDAAGSLLIKFIENARLYGLFPEDYHFENISVFNQQFETDSEGKKRCRPWSKADVLLTDGLLQIIKDVKLGRLPKDSITLRTDSVSRKSFTNSR